MPPAKEIRPGDDRLGIAEIRRRSVSAAMIWALLDSNPDQSMSGVRAGVLVVPFAAAPRPGGVATKVPCPTCALAQPLATSSS
jgi:hypothetical protein